ncbi:hypothetical protein V6N13_018874 [Hibiscus sabdariffa]
MKTNNINPSCFMFMFLTLFMCLFLESNVCFALDTISTNQSLSDGNLVLFNESQVPIWSTNVSSDSAISSSGVAVLSDDGNLVLPSTILWQSFDHPTDTWLPGDLCNQQQLGQDDTAGNVLYIKLAASEIDSESSPTNTKRVIVVAIVVSTRLRLGLMIHLFHGIDSEPLDWKTRYQIALGAARGKRNFQHMSDRKDMYFLVWGAKQVTEGTSVLKLLYNTLNGNANLEEVSRICNVACWCIQDNEIQRPSMSQAVQILEGFMACLVDSRRRGPNSRPSIQCSPY